MSIFRNKKKIKETIFQKTFKIKDLPDDSKPRERLKKYGIKALTNAELLAIILNKGTKERNVLDLSNELLKKNNLKSLADLSLTELQKIKGIGFAKACQILSCFEIAKRFNSIRDEKLIKITNPEDVFSLLASEFKDEKKEHFIALFLDVKKNLIKKEIIFIGTLDTSIIHPREILKSAIKESASAIILSHNHPSGDPMPSNEDIEITKILINACKLISIPLLDHVIIGNKTFFSLRELKELEDLF
ncbi:MAG: DNA repair protein RadC [Candidatus Woesearchaeota archaeon]